MNVRRPPPDRRVIILGLDRAEPKLPVPIGGQPGEPLEVGIQRGRIGISLRELNPSTDGGRSEGARIAEVSPGSPAETAGLRKGDVVVGLNGRPVRGAAELRARLSVVPVGDSVELQVQRGNEKRTLKAQVGAIESGASGGD